MTDKVQLSRGAVYSNKFTVEVTQVLTSDGESIFKTFAMPEITNAVKAFSFEVESDFDTLDDDLDQDPEADDDEDDDDSDQLQEMVEIEAGVLTLYLEVTRESLKAIKKLSPIPEDCQYAVRVTFSDNQNKEVFRHEFRGVLDLETSTRGSHLEPATPMMIELVLSCEKFILFEII